MRVWTSATWAGAAAEGAVVSREAACEVARIELPETQVAGRAVRYTLISFCRINPLLSRPKSGEERKLSERVSNALAMDTDEKVVHASDVWV